jgi:transposase
MSKKYIVKLNEKERIQLEKTIAKGKTAANKITHAHILLKADANNSNNAWTDVQIAGAFGVHPDTVYLIRQRFVEEGFEAALNRKKRLVPGRELKLDGQGEANLIALSCGSPPEGRCRWTLHLLADKLVELRIVDSISHETVRQTLKKTSCSLT